jgi:hypothetical protein
MPDHCACRGSDLCYRQPPHVAPESLPIFLEYSQIPGNAVSDLPEDDRCRDAAAVRGCDRVVDVYSLQPDARWALWHYGWSMQDIDPASKKV